MDRMLTTFVRALRNADVRVSTAETLDAFHAVELVGYRDRTLLKNALSIVLPKTLDEKAAFDAVFDQFFASQSGEFQPPPAAVDSDEGSQAQSSQGTAGEGANEGSEQNGAPSDSNMDSGSGSGQSQGMNADGEAGAESSEHLSPGPISSARSQLGQLLQQSKLEIDMAIAQAGERANVQNISVFTQKGLYTQRVMVEMGLNELQEEIADLKDSPALPDKRLGSELEQRRDWLRDEVRDYVERQFVLHADATGKRLREDFLRRAKLTNIEQRNHRLIQEVIQRMAKRLVTLYSRRRKVFKRGQLHVPRTLRENMRYDGSIFELSWKSTKIDRPKVFAICDVSGSVADYSRFMLMFLYSLEEVLPKVRAFVFSSDLAEITDRFERWPLEEALTRTLHDYGGGSTNYTQAFADFRRLCMDEVDKRTTIIILGDARNNYLDPRTEVLKEMHDRARRVIWLNPESRSSWNFGDSEMRRYGAYCHQVEECNSLMHLERIVGRLLRTVA
jgi:uncharacterized protein with von Willebrand factor type A (vWA) domain